MLIFLLFIYLSGSLVRVGAQHKRFGVSKKDLERLEDLKYDLCGLSPGYTDEEGKWRGVGWFCVPSVNCSGVELKFKVVDDTEPVVGCGELRYNEGRDTCCFTGKLDPPVAFEDPKHPDWDLYTLVKDTSRTQDLAVMEDYKKALIEENVRGGEESEVIRKLRTHSVCAVLPVGEKNGKTLWTPYVCTKNCRFGDIWHPDQESTPGDYFCDGTDTEFRQCCHIASVLEEFDKSKVNDTKTQMTWQFFELESNQSYAPGFRAHFMCEQYNKLVCDGKVDRCAQKVLYRPEHVLPGEFPHHALIGINQPKRQTFHCQGSIVSRLFILTSYECREQDKALANLVLVGTFNFDRHETPIDERFAYVKNHISDHTSHWFLLLKLWRPLQLNPYVKPACINWYDTGALFYSINRKDFDFRTGWIVGYGPFTPDGNFTTRIIRNNFNFQSTKTLSPEQKEASCLQRMSDLRKKLLANKKFAELDNHICVLGRSTYSNYLDKQLEIDKSLKHGNKLGFLSKGASFSTFERYCQWKVYGVLIQGDKYFNHPPLVIETVPYAVAWLEEVIWREDFHFLFFNLSWPDCADWENYKANPSRKGGNAEEADYYYNFDIKDYEYVKPQHNKFFDGVD